MTFLYDFKGSRINYSIIIFFAYSVSSPFLWQGRRRLRILWLLFYYLEEVVLSVLLFWILFVRAIHGFVPFNNLLFKETERIGHVHPDKLFITFRAIEIGKELLHILNVDVVDFLYSWVRKTDTLQLLIEVFPIGCLQESIHIPDCSMTYCFIELLVGC